MAMGRRWGWVMRIWESNYSTRDSNWRGVIGAKRPLLDSNNAQIPKNLLTRIDLLCFNSLLPVREINFFDPWEVVHGQNKLQLEIQKWNQKQRRNWGCIREKLSVLTSSKSKSKDYLRIKVKRDLRLVLSFLRRHQNANESDQREDGEKERERDGKRKKERKWKACKSMHACLHTCYVLTRGSNTKPSSYCKADKIPGWTTLSNKYKIEEFKDM